MQLLGNFWGQSDCMSGWGMEFSTQSNCSGSVYKPAG